MNKHNGTQTLVHIVGDFFIVSALRLLRQPCVEAHQLIVLRFECLEPFASLKQLKFRILAQGFV